jgi:hypothetical protein
VFNAMAAHLSKHDATATWVREAMGDGRSAQEDTARAMDLRFSDKRVTYDPSDPEANLIAASRGYIVISPGSLSGAEWEQVKAHNLSLPAGQVTPSPKPFSAGGKPLRILEREALSREMLQFEAFVHMVGELLLRHSVQVKFANDPAWTFEAAMARERSRSTWDAWDGNGLRALGVNGCISGQGSCSMSSHTIL